MKLVDNHWMFTCIKKVLVLFNFLLFFVQVSNSKTILKQEPILVVSPLVIRTNLHLCKCNDKSG